MCKVLSMHVRCCVSAASDAVWYGNKQCCWMHMSHELWCCVILCACASNRMDVHSEPSAALDTGQ
jgi:hypothetical protein